MELYQLLQPETVTEKAKKLFNEERRSACA